MKRIIFFSIPIVLLLFYFFNSKPDINSKKNQNIPENKINPNINLNGESLLDKDRKREGKIPLSNKYVTSLTKKTKRGQKSIFLEKLSKKPEEIKYYMYGILPGLLLPPKGINYSQYVEVKSSNIVKCIEGDGGRFFFIFDLEKEWTVLFDYKEKQYIFHFEGINKNQKGDELIISSSKTRENYNITYDFKAVLSKSNEIGEGRLVYKYEKAETLKEKTWPFTCEITR